MVSPRRLWFFANVASLLTMPPAIRAAEPVATNPRAMLGSSVFDWEKTVVKPTPVGAQRDLADQPTATLERFECHITTLNPGKASYLPHQHAQEEFIILKEGTLDVSINGVVQRVGPGSLFFFAANDRHNVANAGDTPATYLVFILATARTRSAPPAGAATTAGPGILQSTVIDWAKLAAKDTPTGQRRELFDAPTVTCANLEGHVTTLRPGVRPHPGHHHPDEELIVVKDGLMEVTISGVAQRGGPGSVFFFASNDEHALHNLGEVSATYYVFRIVTEKTPKS